MLDNLDIPIALLRKKKLGRPRKLSHASVVDMEQATEIRQQQWKAIKENRYGTYYNMYLSNELPRFGCGYRGFYVKEGRKWAKLTQHIGDPTDTTSRIRGRLSLNKWSEMKRQHEQLIKRNSPDEVEKRLSRRRRRAI